MVHPLLTKYLILERVRARSEVVRLAKSIGHEQVPAIYDQLVGEFFLLK